MGFSKDQMFSQAKTQVEESEGSMNYPHLTRILSAEFPKLKLDKTTRDLDKIGGIVVNGKLLTIEEFQGSRNLHMEGDLNLNRNKEITSLPEGLRVDGTLDIRYTNITSLPKGLSVGGCFFLEGTNITSLPEGLEVGRSLRVQNTPITSLPKGLRVGRDLVILGTGITSLPEDLVVGGTILADSPSDIQCSEELRKKLDP